MEPLVSTEWLAAELGAPDLVVLDCTYFLPAEGRSATAEFAAARIPGARFLDIDAFADPDSDLPHMVPTPARFAKLAGNLGVSNASRIVFYDGRGIFSAPRGRWLFRLFGHERGAVLDGGLPRWRAENRPTESGDPAPAPAASFVPDLRTDRLAGIGDVKRIVRQSGIGGAGIGGAGVPGSAEPGSGNPGATAGGIPGGGEALLLDARARGRFDGTAPEPRPGLPSGHMPGAANLPATEILAPDGTLLPPDRLRALYAAAGVDGSRRVVTTCGTGVTAAALAFGMERAGLPEAAVYDGSWTEWAGRPETPKVP